MATNLFVFYGLWARNLGGQLATLSRSFTRHQLPVINYRIFVISLAYFTLGIPSGLLSVAWISMQASYSVSLEFLGILAFSGMFGRFTLSMIGASIIDRIGLYKYIFAGSFLTMLAILGIALTPNWNGLVLAMFFMGAGYGILDIGFTSTAIKYLNRRQLNWTYASYGVGLTISPIYFSIMVGQLGMIWQTTYVVAAGIFALLLIILRLQPKTWTLPKQMMAPNESILQTDTVAPTTVFPKFAMAMSVLIFFFYSGVEASTGQLANSLLIDSRHISPATSGLWLSFFWGSFTATRFIFGMFADLVSTRTVIRISYSFGTIGILLVWSNINATTTLLGLMLMGISFAPVYPTLMSETPDRVGAAFSTQAIGFQSSLAGLASAIFPTVGALLAKHVDLEILPPYLVMVFIIYAICYESIHAYLRQPTFSVKAKVMARYHAYIAAR